MLDGADAVALRHCKLQRIVARRDAGADVVLQRGWHAVHHRRQPRIAGQALDNPPVPIGNDVAERHHLRCRIVGPYRRVDQQLNLRWIGTPEREGRDLQRQRRDHERRAERGHDHIARAAGTVLLGAGHELPP